jgi:hypothetical protein
MTLSATDMLDALRRHGDWRGWESALRALINGDAPQIGGSAITATAAEINQAADSTMQARTATADGTGTGAIAATSNLVLITSSNATDQVALPGIAANSLPIGHTIKGRVTANGCELITLASSNETINGVDSDGSNQLDLPAQAAFIAWVESATGWSLLMTATATPDND